ncbi:hypothetical protein ACSQ6I_11895 [Anabaena sp. WFMT]|uniref:hypothetical protein n=1 Tax=Anabaena sp. WFMT TaxID=3449730 RepID=UPI003F26020B
MQTYTSLTQHIYFPESDRISIVSLLNFWLIIKLLAEYIKLGKAVGAAFDPY